MSNDLAKEIARQLALYANFVEEDLNEVADEVADDAVSKLKRTSPERTGDYAKGWNKKKKGNNRTVHNATHPQLTHLLENGHVNRDGSRTRSYPHIKPVEEDIIKDFEVKLTRRLEQ